MAAGRMGKAATKHVPRVYSALRTTHRSQVLDVALECARRGWPVLPVRLNKSPLTRRGVYHATHDPDKATALFESLPAATGYGIATGRVSGIAVLDIDTDEGVAEAERRGLPPTLTVKTGRGWHYYYRLPKGVKLASRDIAPGLELKAEGRYVVGPGSAHPNGGSYEVARDLPIAEAPPWMLEITTKRSQLRHEAKNWAGDSSRVTPREPWAGGIIPEGQRHDTLTSIAGTLHDGSRDLEGLTADLLSIYEEWCEVPETFAASEVRTIAADIFAKPPCKPTAPTVTPEVLIFLDRFERANAETPRKGKPGRTDHDLITVLLAKAREVGTMTDAGVRVSVSYRELAPIVGVSLPTVAASVKRLRYDWITKDDGNRRAKDAGAFILLKKKIEGLLTRGAHLKHSSARCVLDEGEYSCVQVMHLPRLRWGVADIPRLGKTCGAALDALLAAGGEEDYRRLASVIHLRPQDLRRRVIPRLEKHKIVECVGDTVRLTSDWRENLERRRLATGEIAAERRDVERYKRQRRERETGERQPMGSEERTACEELAEIREASRARRAIREERRKAREIRELERVASPAGRTGLTQALSDYLERNPHLRDEYPSCLAVDLWKHSLVEGKPTPEEVEAAVLEIRREGEAA